MARGHTIPIHFLYIRIRIGIRSGLALNRLDIGYIGATDFHSPYRCRLAGFPKMSKFCLFAYIVPGFLLPLRYFRDERGLRISAPKRSAFFRLRYFLLEKRGTPGDTNCRINRSRIIYRSKNDFRITGPPWAVKSTGPTRLKQSSPNEYSPRPKSKSPRPKSKSYQNGTKRYFNTTIQTLTEKIALTRSKYMSQKTLERKIISCTMRLTPGHNSLLDISFLLYANYRPYYKIQSLITTPAPKRRQKWANTKSL